MRSTFGSYVEFDSPKRYEDKDPTPRRRGGRRKGTPPVDVERHLVRAQPQVPVQCPQSLSHQRVRVVKLAPEQSGDRGGEGVAEDLSSIPVSGSLVALLQLLLECLADLRRARPRQIKHNQSDSEGGKPDRHPGVPNGEGGGGTRRREGAFAEAMSSEEGCEGESSAWDWNVHGVECVRRRRG